MADSISELKAKLIDKGIEINKYSSLKIEDPLGNEKALLSPLFKLVSDAKQKANDKFNILISDLRQCLESLLSISYLEMYFSRYLIQFNYIKDGIFLLYNLIERDIENEFSKIYSIFYNNDIYTIKTKKDLRDIKEQFLVPLYTDIVEIIKPPELIEKDSPLKFLSDLASLINNFSLVADNRDLKDSILLKDINEGKLEFSDPIKKNINQILSGESYKIFLNSIIKIILESPIQASQQLLLSWLYIENKRLDEDSFFSNKYTEELESSIQSLISILQDLEVEVDGESNLESLYQMRLDIISYTEEIKARIKSLEEDLKLVIPILREEKENFEVLFQLNEEFGTSIRSSINLIDEIISNSSEVELNLTTETEETVIGDTEEVKDIKFNFLKPFDKFFLDEKKSNSFSDWQNKYKEKTLITDQLENEIILYIGSVFLYNVKASSDYGNEDFFKFLLKNGINSIIYKDLYDEFDDILLGNKSYKNINTIQELRKTESNLFTNYGLRVSSDFNYEKIAPIISYTFPSLSYLNDIDISGKVFSSVDVVFDNKINLIILKALLSENQEEREKKIEKIKNFFFNSKNLFSLRTLFFKHNFLNCFDFLENEKSISNTIPEEDKEIIGQFEEVFNIFYNETSDPISLLEETNLYYFLFKTTKKVELPSIGEVINAIKDLVSSIIDGILEILKSVFGD